MSFRLTPIQVPHVVRDGKILYFFIFCKSDVLSAKAKGRVRAGTGAEVIIMLV